jgi:hypothetical protein
MKRAFAAAWVLWVSLVVAWGCKDRNERVAASYSSVSKPTLSPRPVRVPEKKVAVGIDAIPTEEDYEERAATAINDANLVRKLTELEQEMAF